MNYFLFLDIFFLLKTARSLLYNIYLILRYVFLHLGILDIKMQLSTALREAAIMTYLSLPVQIW